MYQEQNYALPPRYETFLCRGIGVLQHIQMLLSTDATLSDIAQLVQGLQQEFGEQAQLEYVIQTLVSRSLKEQMCLRAQKFQKASHSNMGSEVRNNTGTRHMLSNGLVSWASLLNLYEES